MAPFQKKGGAKPAGLEEIVVEQRPILVAIRECVNQR
jgi:hypothetical protein